jgi:hypothetical protein
MRTMMLNESGDDQGVMSIVEDLVRSCASKFRRLSCSL